MENQLTPNNSMILEIRELLENARKNVAQQVNTQLLTTYWNIGRIIVEYEQQNQIRADYGKQTLRELSKELTREFGKGFSRSNLQNMRAFYLAYKKVSPTLQLPCPSILRGLGVSFCTILVHNSLMSILQDIFRDHYEEMIYTLHPRDSVIENVDKMINCGNPAYGGAMYGCPSCGKIGRAHV